VFPKQGGLAEEVHLLAGLMAFDEDTFDAFAIQEITIFLKN